MKVLLITGNKEKAKYFSKYLDMDIEHKDIDLNEIQSLDLKEIIKHKAIEAYRIVKKPILVEDISLEFKALGRLPGPFIKFFVKELSLQEICDLVNGKSREATVKCAIGYYDGEKLQIFEGKLEGRIAESPGKDNNFDWDRIFIPNGYEIPRSEFKEEDYKETYLKIRRLDLVKKYLEENSN